MQKCHNKNYEPWENTTLLHPYVKFLESAGASGTVRYDAIVFTELKKTATSVSSLKLSFISK